MKATMSRDGRKRFDLRIIHRVGAEDFADCLCLRYRGHDGPLPKLSRAAVLKAVREVLAQDADARYWWRDNVGEESASELAEWAREQVRQGFPELH